MKAVVLTGIRQLELRDVPAPALTRDDEVLVRIAVVGVCGSDVHYYHEGGIGSQRIEYPWAIGHECAGTIVKVGPAVTEVGVGDRVAVDPLIWCTQCDRCLAGRENTCRNQRFLGNPGEASGAMAELLVMPAASCFRLPEAMTFVEAALCEPLAIGEYARRFSGAGEGATVGVFGSGPIGLSVLAALQAGPACRTFATDLLPERRAMADSFGAEWTGSPEEQDVAPEIGKLVPGGLDLAFECAGEQDTLDQAIELLAPGGKLMVIGTPETKTITINYDIARRREHTVQMVRRQNRMTGPALDLVASGRVDVARLVTHHFGLDQAAEALEMVLGYRDGVIKAMMHVTDEE
ncbi:MAG: zinc-dependent alcohol dehydrogenase [Planctomycetota bacterium]|jgi:L-iditol 2-dehydrogenase